MTDPIQATAFHVALHHAVLAIAAAEEAALPGLSSDQVAVLRKRLADGTGQLALFVSSSGKNVHIELALIDSDAPSVFKGTIVKGDASILAAVAPAGKVTVVDRGKMN